MSSTEIAPARVCVLGCSGFVGSHVTAALLERGYTVHGTLRPSSRTDKDPWLRERLAPLAKEGASLELFSASMTDPQAVTAALDGCAGVFFCAGTERQEPRTIELMMGGVRTALEAAREREVPVAVITSSTGSTNPPGPEPRPKREGEHVSDPMQQISVGKYSPAAKTLMEALALRMAKEAGDALRVSIMNPSLILGPAFQPELPSSLRFLHQIVTGERMTEEVPTGSMSIIDVRDLAALQVRAFEQPEAHGRYFAVKRSWPWRDILAALEQLCPPYSMPAQAPEPDEPSAYDLSRQETLGHTPRDLHEILEGALGELRQRGLLEEG